MRTSILVLTALGTILWSAPGGGPRRALEVVRANPNLQRAGVLHDGVLTIALEAKESLWRVNGADRPPMTIEAFAEPGKDPLIPGPLVRVAAGTKIHFEIYNALTKRLTFRVPVTIRGGPDRYDAMDSIAVDPGATGTLLVEPTTPGSYIYRATTSPKIARSRHLTGLLAGALVIDSAGGPPPHDRVFVLMGTGDSATSVHEDTASTPKYRRRDVFTINGLSWPNTERIHAVVGDSVHWRLINASELPHPMHLHGFYYRVDDFSGPETGEYGSPAKGQMVVTAFMSGFSTMSMTWSPDRPGNWLFHCHFAVHLRPDSLLAERDDPYDRMMVGLVLGTMVAARHGVVAAGEPTAARRLRLVAQVDHPERVAPHAFDKMPSTVDSVPDMHFVLEEAGRTIDTRTDLSPELDLVRGEPVAITIVNQLPEATTVHWHGIEIEDSYADGVPGFSGEGTHLTPAIAPGDSFTARFTPPRAGTFMYHAHLDEIREQLAGLEGALIVREPGSASAPDEHTLFLKDAGPARRRPRAEINGKIDPDTIVLHAGRPARLRLLDLNTNYFAALVVLAGARDTVVGIPRDDLLERWRPMAKDGFPQPMRSLTPARQVISIGETYDFDYTPERSGSFVLEVWRLELPEMHVKPPLLITVPIRVE